MTTTPPEITIHYAALTHRGKPFARNQDAILIAGQVIQKPEILCGTLAAGTVHPFAISDGVSGHPQPAAAARVLLESLRDTYPASPKINPQGRTEQIQTRLMAALDHDPRLEDAAATLVVAEASAAHIRLWHAGDSRGYRLMHGKITRLTEDHTTLSILCSEGSIDDDKSESFAETLFAAALDNIFVYSHFAEPPTVSVTTLQLKPGESLVLVSDGVTAVLSDKQMAECLHGNTLYLGIENIHRAVMDRGAPDDLSVIILQNRPCASTHPDAPIDLQ